MDPRPDGDLEDAAVAAAGDELGKRLAAVVGGVEGGGEAAVEALGVGLGGGGGVTGGGVRVEFIVGGVVEVVDAGGAGDAVVVEAVVADLVVALGVVAAGIGAKLVAVRVGLAAGRGVGEGRQGLFLFFSEAFRH